MYVFCFQYFASLNTQNKKVFGHLEATCDATLCIINQTFLLKVNGAVFKHQFAVLNGVKMG